MQVITSRGAGYRTRLLTFDQARRFARCLSANRRFERITVERHAQASGQRRFHVRFAPRSAERQEAILDTQQEARIRRAAEEFGDFFWALDFDADGRPFAHCHSLKSGGRYRVTETACTCGDFIGRCRGNGLRCKHIVALAGVRASGGLTAWPLAAPAAAETAPAPLAGPPPPLTEEERAAIYARMERDFPDW